MTLYEEAEELHTDKILANDLYYDKDSADYAVSGKDNKTLICPDCGTREALEILGISEGERKKILGIIHQNIFDNSRQKR